MSAKIIELKIILSKNGNKINYRAYNTIWRAISCSIYIFSTKVLEGCNGHEVSVATFNFCVKMPL